MTIRFKTILLVSLQFFFIFLLLSSFPLNKISLSAYIFMLFSFVLILWALIAMQKSKLRILPEPSANAILITKGPYRFIRHPMYTAILLGSIGLLINYFTWLRLAIAVALAIVLLIKLNWEEKMLSQKFDEYKEYMKHTRRILPLLF